MSDSPAKPLQTMRQTVIVCRDGEKRRKRRSERASPPVFDALVEVAALDRWRVHRDVAASVDALLEGAKPPVQVTVCARSTLAMSGHVVVACIGTVYLPSCCSPGPSLSRHHGKHEPGSMPAVQSLRLPVYCCQNFR